MRYIGFSGTRKGMTSEQIRSLEALLPQYHQHGYRTIHHGAAVGSDREVHTIFRRLFAFHMWPSNEDQAHWAKLNLRDGDFLEQIRPPLERNRFGIVGGSNLLVAAVAGPEKDFPRSGTWATIRYAREALKNRYIVKPDGAIDVEVAS